MPQLQRIFQTTDGKLEALIAVGLLLGASMGILFSKDYPGWQLIVAGVFLTWSMILAPETSIRSTGVLLCVVVGLFIADVEFGAFVAVLAFFVVEIQLTNARWIAGSCSILIVLVWFTLGKPLTAWSVSLPSQILFAVLGILISLVIALYRRLNMSLFREQDAAVELAKIQTRIDVAKALHNGVADSLTRIVLLAHQKKDQSRRDDLIQQEAKSGVVELRKIIDQLKGIADAGPKVLVGLSSVIEKAVVELELLGFEVTVESSVSLGDEMDEDIGVALREVMTNVMKYGESQVKIFAEANAGMAEVMVVNRIREVPQDPSNSSGIGMASVRSILVERGGALEFSDESGMMRTLLEFPIENREE